MVVHHLTRLHRYPRSLTPNGRWSQSTKPNSVKILRTFTDISLRQDSQRRHGRSAPPKTKSSSKGNGRKSVKVTLCESYTTNIYLMTNYPMLSLFICGRLLSLS